MGLEELAVIWAKPFMVSTLRYIIIGGLLVCVHRYASRIARHIPVRGRRQSGDSISRIAFAIQSFAIYNLFGLVIYFTRARLNYSPVYTDISTYGWPYFFFSILFFIIASDTAFYWLHRLMHRKRFYRSHALHHRYTDVSAWAGYSFHWSEALLLAVFTLAIPGMVIPWHPTALFIFSTLSVAWGLYIHSGFEIFPDNWRAHQLFKWINTSTHHSLHHQFPGYNFSFWFTFWDKVMGTEYLYQETAKRADLAATQGLGHRPVVQ